MDRPFPGEDDLDWHDDELSGHMYATAAESRKSGLRRSFKVSRLQALSAARGTAGGNAGTAPRAGSTTGQSAPACGGCEQAQGAGDGLGPVVGAELGVQVADVGPDGVR
jgi:hypothetical protein